MSMSERQEKNHQLGRLFRTIVCPSLTPPTPARLDLILTYECETTAKGCSQGALLGIQGTNTRQRTHPSPPHWQRKGDTGSRGYITPPQAVKAPLGSAQTRPTILGSTHIPGSHLAVPPFLALCEGGTPAPIHQSFQGRAEQAHKPTHLGWVLKTQAGALHPSSSASFSTDVFGLLSFPPDNLIGEARPRAVPQGLPKSPLRPAPGPAAAPAFPAAVEVEQRLSRWPSSLLLDHRGRRCPSPWPLGSASDPPSRAHPPAESQPVELSRRAGGLCGLQPTAGGSLPCGHSPSSSSLVCRLREAQVGTAAAESLPTASKPLRFSKERSKGSWLIA